MTRDPSRIDPILGRLRAALRAAVLILSDPVLRNDENARTSAAERFRALADAPPTVAELLAALPDPPGGCGPGAHRVEWSHDDMRFRANRYGHAGLVVEEHRDGKWSRTNLNHADLAQPATLVEVTP